MKFETLHALIIDPKPPRRSQLKEMLNATDRYKSVRMSGAFADADQLMKIAQDVEVFDVIFISREFALDKIRTFIKESGTKIKSQDAVFVMLLLPDVSTMTATGEALALGVHSCLKEPYSVDDVRQVTQQALALKAEFIERRNRTAVRCLVKEAMKHLDLLYRKLKAHRDPGSTLRDLKNVGVAITQVSAELRELYFETLVEEFIKARVPYFLPGMSNYSGSSPHTKKRAAQARNKEGTAGENDAEAAARKKEPPKVLPGGRIIPPR